MTYIIQICIIEMLRRWLLFAISERSSSLMYKGKLSVYTPNMVTSHDTCKGLRKSHGMVFAIRYRGSTSQSSLSISFDDPSIPYLFYTVNKHKWMTINTLFVSNPFLLITNTKKQYTCYEKGCTRCVSQARKVLSVCPTN